MKYIIHTDGGSRGNPGPAAIGVVIAGETGDMRHETGRPEDNKTGKQLIAEFGKAIGETTNNVAEYTAVIEALKYLRHEDMKTGRHEDGKTVHFFLDSALVVNQMNGLFKVKDNKMRELLTHAKILENELGGNVTYTAVPREQNKRADELVNEALDAK